MIGAPKAPLLRTKRNGVMENYERKYFELLSKKYPNVQSAATELINLSAILNLPKGTEHYIADIHGEYDAFNHYLKNASGILRRKIDAHFKTLPLSEKKRLAFFIYYPTDMLGKYQKALSGEAYETLLRDTLKQMVELARIVVSKYTKSKVRKTLPDEFAYIIQELIYESDRGEDKARYFEAIIDALFKTEREKKMIVELSRFIRKLSIDRLHVVGDIFDRGPKPHMVMERLIRQKRVDVQWGNHDIIWLGAASGSRLMIANVLRIAARYNNLDCLEDGYGINIRPLANFANRVYKKDTCKPFYPKKDVSSEPGGGKFVARLHKAIAIIQFKLEGEVVRRNPEFGLEDRLMLHKIDYDKGTISLNGKNYELNDQSFPTIDRNSPYSLTEDENAIMDHLRQLFLHNEMLQKHVRFLFRKGSMILPIDNTLLFHAGFPLNEDGSFMAQSIRGKAYKGKALFEKLEQIIRNAYLNRYEKDTHERDWFMFLWQGSASPLFAKDAMKTFERYYIEDKTTHKEIMNPYFNLRTRTDVIQSILEEYDIPYEKGRIVNGHVPMDVTRGEDVVLADKHIYLIDGGMSKEYQKATNIGGYTLIADSYAYYLVSHSRFSTYQALIDKEEDIVSVLHSEDLNERRTYVYDTDNGKELKRKVDDLAHLIDFYRSGTLKEKDYKQNGA